MGSFARRISIAAVITALSLVSKPSAAEVDRPLAAVSAREGEPFFDRVDPRTGAMTYAYQFDLPNARGLSGPSLGLQYNSSTRDREAGYGWGLDLPVIERRPLAGRPLFDSFGNPVGEERYAFNGQPLVKVCDVGACPEEPSTQGHPEWASGWAYYRVQVEGQFARFYRSPHRQTWYVLFKGGELVEFGAPGEWGDSYGLPSAVERTIAGAYGRVVRLHPVIRRDLSHPANVVLYKWQPYGSRGLLYLTDIYDTPSLSAPTSVGAFAHHTQLNWDGIPFPAGNHQSPERAMPDWRLARVAVASMPWSGTGPREVYRVYTLAYYAPRGPGAYDPLTQGPLWHHSFLKQINLQGRCGQSENGDGTIGPTQQCGATGQLPPVKFEYEPGTQIGYVTDVSQIEAGPPGAVSGHSVLPYPASAAIVDFDRDGLPDVIQSWEGPYSFSRRVAVRDHGASGQPELYSLKGPPGGDADDYSLRTARPILGYLNRGSGNSFRYQCMDAGPLEDLNSVLFHNAGPWQDEGNHITKFFNASSNTVLGAFGGALGVWGRNAYLPFFARLLGLQDFAPGQAPANFALGGCHLDGQFSSASFFPRWTWETSKHEAWTYPAPREQTVNDTPEWFVDIDGDGYADALRPIPWEENPGTSDFRRARVAFTRKYGVGETAPQVPTPVPGPALVPFVEDTQAPLNSLAPLENGTWDPAPNGRHTQVFYADVNGDGLPDLVTSNFQENGGALRIRPGDGTGRFKCGTGDPWNCLQDPEDAATWYYEATIASANKPYSIVGPGGGTAVTWFYLHDVTGDGLADIIRYSASTLLGNAPGGIEVWVNQDGQTFACVGTGGTCTVANVFDTVNNEFVTNGRVTFADMDADGIDDIVILAKQGIFRASVFHPTVASPARGTHPGQLIRIQNGFGATTEIHYSSIQELDVAASTSGKPWTHHSPIVEAVVTDVVTANSAVADPYSFRRKVHYAYRDPAYDSWQRRLVGFRKVSTRVGDEAAITETTSWFGPCETATPPSRDANGANSPNHCFYGSDDEFAANPTFRSWVGKPVRVDRYIPADPGQGVPGQYLWSRYFEYAPPITLLSPSSERHVTYTYAPRVETHLYRPEQVASPGSSFVPLAGGDPIERSPVQAGSKTIEQRSLVDTNGTVLEQRDSRDAAEGDRLRVTQFSDNAFGEALAITCDQSWRCLPRHVTMASDVGSLVPLRRTRLTYDVTTADVTLIEGFLEENHGLVRFHEAGDWVHNAAPNQATAGWKWLGHFDYTPRGFVALATGPGAPDTPSRACTRFVPDDIYGHFPKTILNFKDGCDSASRLETNLTFDRGFGVPVATTAPDLGVSLVMLDAFGRPQDVFEPGPDLPSPALEKTAHFEYGDRSAVSYVDVVRYTAPGGSEAIRSVQLMNGLLEPVLRFDQGDAEAWIASGWTLRDNAGRAYLTHRPFAVSPGVNPTAVGGPSVSPPGTGVFVSSMDGFGRQYSVTENGTQIFARSFEPLAVVSRDAEQVGAGAHVGAYTRVEHTTRGQVRRIKTHAAGGADVTTVSTYDGADKLSTVTRTSSAGGLYTRRVSWDSLGRLVKNWEPNTTSPATTWGWVYAWNDANRLAGTSDARGCGKDFHYDSLGRVVGEDYTPCLASQAPYSRADPATGADFEVVNRYDDYEPGQVAPDATFADNAVLATGRLVSTRDRGAVTRYSYDNRGRVRRVARQVAKPLSQQGAGVEPYTPHWYKQRSDFDNAGRLTWRSSGADEGPFADGPGTAESYGYSARGLLQAVSSAQHGLIIDKISYEVDGQVDQIRYGDVAHTTADPHYDSRRRMDGYKVERAAPALWTTPSAQYSLPTTDTTQTILADFTYGYDLVGNPLTIEDHASAADWRDYAWPQRMRSMGYDDLYRVTSVTYGYGTPSGAGSFRSPFAPETNAGDRSPVPLQTQLATRVQNETFTYDFLGNIASSTDDQNAAYDRSLGVVTHGDGAGARPNQLTAANGVQARYDASGNLVELKVERAGTCATGPAGSKCAQWFAYDWNEVGELARARRWDYTSSLPTLGAGATVPPETPEWDLNYAYSGGARVVKSATDSFGSRHTLEIFDTLRLDHDEFLTAQGDYKRDRRQTHVYLAGGVGHVFYDGDGSLPAPPTTQPTRLFLNIGDHLGSASLTIDHTSSELVERATFHSHGAIESDYRTNRWDNAREPYKFTGKEEDIEVGATYFGARYYNAHLGRFLSADPLTIHGLAGDLNPYAYVRGRVMSHVDPFGLEDKPAAGPAQQPYPQPQPGTVQQGPRTTVETSGSGSPPPPTHAEIIAARTADTFARIEGAHIPTGGGTYIAVGDVHRETVNAVATAPVNLLASLLDPSGIMRIVAATSGHPVAPRVIAASTDPKNVSSNAVGLALGIAGVAGARSLAAEGGGGASSSSFVYQLVDGAGEPVYFGLTNNPAVRVAQHGRMPPGPFSGMQVISDPLPLPQAQALETSLIGQAHAEGTFIYNLSPTSISPTAPVAVPPTIFPSLTLLNPKIYKPR